MTETIGEDEEVVFGEAINRGSKLKKTNKMQDCFCFKVAGVFQEVSRQFNNVI